LLERAGFRILRYEQIPGVQEDVAAGFGSIRTSETLLRWKLGEAAAAALILEASITLQLRPYSGMSSRSPFGNVSLPVDGDRPHPQVNTTKAQPACDGNKTCRA